CVEKAKLALKPEFVAELDGGIDGETGETGETGASGATGPTFAVDSAAWDALRYLADYVAGRDR
ncbi:MAG: hypothetical protein IJE77_08410, partial [Thermoguttaceae bacterium]|nr:hypothetical protein [Thermoguttaceae bacterium]